MTRFMINFANRENGSVGLSGIYVHLPIFAAPVSPCNVPPVSKALYLGQVLRWLEPLAWFSPLVLVCGLKTLDY